MYISIFFIIITTKIRGRAKKGNIAYLKLDKLMVEKQTDENQEKWKRDLSFLPDPSTPQTRKPSYVASKVANTTNPFEYMARARSNSLKNKPNVQ